MQPTTFCFAARTAARLATHTALAVLCITAAILASPRPAQAGNGFVNAVKIGALAHDVIESHRAETGTDINGEILFQPVDLGRDPSHPAWLNALLDPRPLIGASVNVSGYTSQYYIGLNWHTDLWQDVLKPADHVYAEFAASGAIHDGKLDASDPHREALGSRVLFHLSLELGYAFDGHYSIGGYYEHDSNGGLAKYNRSLNNVGVRLGYKL